MSPLLATAIGLLALALPPGSQAAASCSPKPGTGQLPADRFKSADAVFVATTVPGSSQGQGANETLALEVLKAWKGKPASGARYAQKRFGACSFTLKEGVTYLIFASLEKGTYAAAAFNGTGDIQHSALMLRALEEHEMAGTSECI